jgi:hypothetical protein
MRSAIAAQSVVLVVVPEPQQFLATDERPQSTSWNPCDIYICLH